MSNVHIVIPARLESTRLPRKLLQDLEGQTVLERVYKNASLTKAASITIATDSEEIYQHAKAFSPVVMTDTAHQSGTDRVAEAIIKQGIPEEAIVVNVQGDEPFIDPLLIHQVAEALAREKADVATLCWPIVNRDDYLNPNVVKVVRNYRDEALYFSRAPIPFIRDGVGLPEEMHRHIGLYAYRAAFLKKMVNMPPCVIEETEKLEQLRILWNGGTIIAPIACVLPQQDINTEEDLEQARAYLRAQTS